MMKTCSNSRRQIGLDKAIFYGFSSIFLQVLKPENLTSNLNFEMNPETPQGNVVRKVCTNFQPNLTVRNGENGCRHEVSIRVFSYGFPLIFEKI